MLFRSGSVSADSRKRCTLPGEMIGLPLIVRYHLVLLLHRREDIPWLTKVTAARFFLATGALAGTLTGAEMLFGFGEARR